MIVGCSKPVEDSTLINKDGLMYITDSDKPYTGEVFTNYSTGEKEYQGTYENGLLIQYSYLNKDGSIKEPVNIETLIDRGGNLFEINGQKPYTGDIFELYPNGNKKLSGSLKGGKFDGELIEYYSNGQMLIKEMYVGGVKNGSYNSWFENGQKESEETFKGGKQDGLWIRWNSDGVKIEEKTYVVKAEAAEDAVISQITSGLETFATEQLMANGRRSWPTDPFTALETKPAGYDATSENADADGEWRFYAGTANITHQRADNTVWHWDYERGTQSGANAAPGSMGARTSGVD